jgi:hypothetical protein
MNKFKIVTKFKEKMNKYLLIIFLLITVNNAFTQGFNPSYSDHINSLVRHPSQENNSNNNYINNYNLNNQMLELISSLTNHVKNSEAIILESQKEINTLKQKNIDFTKKMEIFENKFTILNWTIIGLVISILYILFIKNYVKKNKKDSSKIDIQFIE